MTFNFLDFTSKTVWLGLVMVLAGILKSLGLDIPVVMELINSFYPDMDGGGLISAGLGMMFVKEAITKVGG